jgi:hypothetical protein
MRHRLFDFKLFALIVGAVLALVVAGAALFDVAIPRIPVHFWAVLLLLGYFCVGELRRLRSSRKPSPGGT